MPSQFCKFHPLEPAVWRHPSQNTLFCDRCVDRRETAGGLESANCYLTGASLEYLGAANTAKPFWERLDQCFRYPLLLNGLLFIVLVMAAVAVLVSLNPLFGLPFKIIGAVALLALVTRYGFVVIEQTSEGDFKPPSLKTVFAETGFEALFQQTVVQAVYIAVLLMVGFLDSGLLDNLTLAILVLAWPASVMLLATEKSIGGALSPTSIGHLIGGIGWSYLLLYGFLALLWIAAATLFALFANEIPIQYLLPVLTGVYFYFLVVACHLMGYVLFQYQAALGFVADDRAARKKSRPNINPADAKIELMIKSGQYGDAIEKLTQQCQGSSGSLRHHDHLAKILLALGDKDQALAHGQHYLSILHRMGDSARLYFLYSSYQQLDDQFKPDDPAVCLGLAQQWFDRGKYREVCTLLTGMHKRTPDFEGVPDAYLLVAQSLLLGFGDRDRALQYLQYIKVKHPTFQRLAEVEPLLAQQKNHGKAAQ